MKAPFYQDRDGNTQGATGVFVLSAGAGSGGGSGGGEAGVAIDDALGPVAGFSANGTLVKTRPAGATAIILDLPVGSSITFTLATSAPGAPPASTITVAGSSYGQYSRALGPNVNMYVTALTGAVTAQYV